MFWRRPRGPGPVSPRAAPFAHAEIDGVRNYLVVAEVDRDETACGADEKVQIDVKANLQWQGELAAVDFVEVPVPRAHSHGTRPRLPRPHLVRGVDVLANDPTTAEPFLRRRASAVCPELTWAALGLFGAPVGQSGGALGALLGRLGVVLAVWGVFGAVWGPSMGLF